MTVLALVIAFYAGAKLLYALALIFSRKISASKDFPFVSVWLAARNEENCILDSLESLAAQNYPMEKMEVWIGDDESSDRTAEIVKKFCESHPRFQYLCIDKNLEGLKGKQNVLAQLAKKSKGEVFLVTDADMVLPSTWMQSLVSELSRSGGMVCGTTLVKAEGLFAGIQTLDWMMGMGIMKAHQTLSIPITAVGNNMAFTAKAYEASGGYEALPFSLTEDYKLFQDVCEKRNFSYFQQFHPDSLGWTRPARNFSELLRQRKRWFESGREIAWYNKALLLFNAMVMPALIAGFFLLPLKVAVLFWWVKVICDGMFLFINSLFLNCVTSMMWFPLYELYYQMAALILPINQLWPGKIIWKGRKY